MARRSLDVGAVSLAVACGALLIAQHVAARACRDALFLSTFGSTALPKAMLAAAAVGLFAVLGSAQLITRFGPGRVVPGLLLVSGLLHLLEWQLFRGSERAAVVLVYLHVSIAGAIAVSGFWSVVNERFDPHTVKTMASRIGAGLAVGGLIGGFATRSLSGTYGLRSMLLVLVATSALAGLGISRLSRGSSAVALPEEPSADARSRTSRPYLVAMAMLLGLTGLSSSIVDFTFKATVSNQLSSGVSMAGFFALFYMVVSIVSVALQLTVTRWVLARHGIGAGLASLPIAVVGLGLLGVVVPAAWVLTLLRGTGAVLESSLFRAAYEPLYAPLPVAEKRAKKSLIDVACDRLGEALGSGSVLVLAAIAPALASHFGLALAVAASVCAAMLALRLEQGYVTELGQSLRSGRVHLDTADVSDATTMLMLSQTQAGLDREVLLRRIEDLHKAGDGRATNYSPGARELLAALSEGEPERISHALAAAPLDIELASLVIACLERDDLADAAVVALRPLSTNIAGQLVDALLDRKRPLKLRRRIPRVLRVAAHPRAVRGLAEALTDPEPEIRFRSALALRELSRQHPELSPPRRLVIEAATRELEGRDERAFDQVITLLYLVLDAEALELALRAQASPDEKLRGTGIEYLEQVIPEPIRGRLWPYLQAGRQPRESRVRRPAEIVEELRRSMG